jgi:hypothetical protein
MIKFEKINITVIRFDNTLWIERVVLACRCFEENGWCLIHLCVGSRLIRQCLYSEWLTLLFFATGFQFRITPLEFNYEFIY